MPGSGEPLATTAAIKLMDQPVTPRDWSMSVGTGDATTDTGAIKAMIDYAIAHKRRVYIPSSYGGVFKIIPGQLCFDCHFTDGVRGAQFVVDSASTIDAPILTITNGTPRNQSEEYFRGSRVGGLSFKDSRTGSYANTHALSLQGIVGTMFGYLYAEDLNGSLLFCPENLFEGRNPDPTAISACRFEAIEGIRLKGWTIDNRNWDGFDGVDVAYVRGVENSGGGIYGVGQGCSFHEGSFGGCQGWAFDDGTNSAATGGPPNRLLMENFEIDGCEYGIRLNRMTNASVRRSRIIHRYKSGKFNRDECYWPRVSLSMAEGMSANIQSVDVDLIHRVERGGPKKALGTFVQTSHAGSGSLAGITVDLVVLENAGFGIADTELYTGLNSNGQVLIRRSGRTIWDSRARSDASISIAGSAHIAASGYAGQSGIIPFDLVRWDLCSNFDAGLHGFRVPYSGLYAVRGCIEFRSPERTMVRLAVLCLRAGSYEPLATRTLYAESAGNQTYEIAEEVEVIAGDVLFLSADQNSGSPIGLTPTFNSAASNVFQIRAV